MSDTEFRDKVLKVIIRILRFAAGLFEKVRRGEEV